VSTAIVTTTPRAPLKCPAERRPPGERPAVKFGMSDMISFQVSRVSFEWQGPGTPCPIPLLTDRGMNTVCALFQDHNEIN
jgi:hypothetical protein